MTEEIKDFNTFKNFGYMNAWVLTPELVKECIEAKHKQYYTSVGNCITLYWCPICKYKFKVDSGD